MTSVTLTVSVVSGQLATGQSVIVRASVVGGSATADNDYTSTARDITFSSGSTSQTFSVDIADDTLVEGMEDFTVSLTGVSGDVTLSVSTAMVTILDDDVLTVGFVQPIYSVPEDEGSVTLTVSVLSGQLATGQSVIVRASVVDGSATAGSDYTSTASDLTFSSGLRTQTLSIDINDDALFEGMEDFTVSLTRVSGDVTLSVSTAVVTIEDNDVLTVGFVQSAYRILEGDGSVTLTVSVLSGSLVSGASVTVGVRTVDGSATKGNDYAYIERVLTFTSEATTRTLSVVINDDELLEGLEEFTVHLTTLSKDVMLSASTAMVTIEDNDVLTVGFVQPAYRVSEDVGSVTLTVSVVSGGIESGANVTVGVSTVDGSATASRDYAYIERVLIFTSEARTQTLSVDINDDGLFEDLEEFTVHLTTLREDVMISVSTALVTIEDDDVLTLGFVQSRYRVSEDGGSVTLTVSVLSGQLATGQSVIVRASAVDGSATAGSDYTATASDLTFSSGSTSQTFSVNITDDALVEGLEDFTVSLTRVSGDVTLSVSTAVVTIEDNDVLTVGFVQSSYRVSEDGGSVTLTVSVLSGQLAIGQSVIVRASAVSGSATAGSDYTATASDLTFSSGSTTQTLSVVINDDELLEGLEEFTVHFTTLREDVMISVSTAMVTILDDDVLTVGFVQLIYSVLEDEGSVTLTVSVVSGSLVAGASVTAGVRTVDGSATTGNDYTGLTDTVLTFTSEAVTQTVSIDINNDASVEGSEIFTVHLTTSSDVLSLSVSRATVTILDNDNSRLAVVPSTPPAPPPRRRSGGGGGGGNDEPDDIIDTSDTAETQEPPQPVTISSPNEVVMLETLNGNTPEFDVDKTVIDELNDEELMRSTAEVRPPLRVSLLYGVDVTLRDSAGADVKIVEEALRVCFPITVEITQRVNGDYEKLTIYHLMEELSAWEEILSIYDAETEQVCGDAKEFSIYALGFVDAGALLPPTGGVQMRLWGLVLVTLAGVLLIVVGARRVYSRS